MVKVTKKAERLARALATVESPLAFSMAFDRAHWNWPQHLEKAQEIIAAQNLLEFCESTRPLHGFVENAEVDEATYYAEYMGPHTHDKATALVHGLEDDHE